MNFKNKTNRQVFVEFSYIRENNLQFVERRVYYFLKYSSCHLFDLAPRGDRNIPPSEATQPVCRKHEVRSVISKVYFKDPKGSADQLPRIHFSNFYFDVYTFFIEEVVFFKL
jgi:hypothetical protein